MSAPSSRLAPGATLGPYEIVELLGAGGMGEVYRARDTRLDRAVAVKVLPETRAGSVDMRQRFEREARAISALQHPHICTLHDVGREGDTDFLVMELLEGESLAARLLRGAMPLEQVLRVGREMAEALDYAHRRGIVHRDLKPGNVMLTRAGAKLLDFGLARVHAPDSAAVSRSVLAGQPTQDRPLTAEGTILGTFQYMAPEQLEGREADARTDLFALGAVLHEMATGRKAFEGKSQASLIAAIMSSEPPPVSSVQKLSPPALDRLVRTCLAKDADDRWQSAHDVAAELAWIREAGSQTGTPAPVMARRRRREWWAWLAAAAAVLLAGGLALERALRPPPAPRTLRLHLAPPRGASFDSTDRTASLAPDGARVVYGLDVPGEPRRLWVRDLARLEAVALPGSESCYDPFWSADSRWVGCFSDDDLVKIDASGGSPAQRLATVFDGRGASWGPDGTILFVPRVNGGVWRVRESGGEPEAVTRLDPAEQEIVHGWPQWLPGGRRFLYYVRSTKEGRSGLFVGEPGTPLKQLVRAQTASAQFAAPGFLFFVRESTLLSQPFDPRALRTTGEPVPVAFDVEYVGRYDRGAFSAPTASTFVYHSRNLAAGSQLRFVDREGKELGTLGTPGDENADLEPSGRRLAVMRLDDTTKISDLWIYDLERGVRTRFTSEPDMEIGPVWSPDGRRLAFTVVREGAFLLVARPAQGGAEEILHRSNGYLEPVDWSPDARLLVYEVQVPDHRLDLMLLPIGGGDPVPLAATEFEEHSARFSPDGRWVAYESNETGRSEIFVQPMPPTGAKWLASTAGGRSPRWSADARRLFFLSERGQFCEVDVLAGAEFASSPPRELFLAPGITYEPLPDGERFLFGLPAGADATPLVVVTNAPTGSARP